MSVLDELLVLPAAPGMTRMTGIDPFECLDAASEDANGRLPHETGYIDPFQTRSNTMALDNTLTQGRREKILSLLATTRELEELCGVSRGALQHLLRDLEREDEIAVAQPGTRSGPAVYSRSNPSGPTAREVEEVSRWKEELEQEAEGVSVADVEDLERRAAAAEAPNNEFDAAYDATLRGRYIDFLAREHPMRLLYLVLEGKIKATDDVLEAIEKVVF